MKMKGFKELVFELRKRDEGRSDLEALNGEVESEAGMIGRVHGTDGDLPETGWSGERIASVLSAGAQQFPSVRFGLERVSMTAGSDPDQMTGYSMTFQTDVENADQYVRGVLSRPDQVSYSKVRKGFSTSASAQLQALRRQAYDRNLLMAPAWVAAAWRLNTGEYCFAGPPVLLVADCYQPQLTIDSAVQNGKTTYVSGKILQRFCRLLCRVDADATLPAAVDALDLFLLAPSEPGYDVSGEGAFGTVRTDPVSVSGKTGPDGALSGFAPVDYGEAYFRKRSWAPDGSGYSAPVPLPEGLRLVASIARSRLPDFATFAEPEYSAATFRQIQTKTVFAPDYGYCFPITTASFCRIASRRLIFNIVRGVAGMFGGGEMASCRDSGSDAQSPSRLLVGIRKGGRNLYSVMTGSSFSLYGGTCQFGTSLFYPDPDAFEFVAEVGAVRYRLPLRSAGGGAFRTMFDEVREEAASVPLSASAESLPAPAGELRLESENIPNLYPLSLRSRVEDTGRIIYIGDVEGEPNALYLFSETGVHLLRLSAKGKISVISRPFSGGKPEGIVPTGKGYLFRLGESLYLIESGRLTELSSAGAFEMRNRPPANLLARLPLAEKFLAEYCDPWADASARIVSISYHRESALVKVLTESGETFAGKLPEPDWVYVGLSSGSEARGYLLTRPIKISGGESRLRAYGLDLLFSGAEREEDMQTLLYGSDNMNDWIPLAIGRGGRIRVFGYSSARFFRVLHVGRNRPEGIAVHLRERALH